MSISQQCDKAAHELDAVLRDLQNTKHTLKQFSVQDFPDEGEVGELQVKLIAAKREIKRIIYWTLGGDA